MSQFLAALKSRTLVGDGATGSLLFQRTGRLSEENHVYESFNCDQPNLVLDVHSAYVEAGVDCLTTNTFGANPHALRRYGLQDRTTDLNHAGAALAKNAFAQAHRDGFVLGSIGPTASSARTPEELRAVYCDQIHALCAASVDALILETFADLTVLESVISLVREQSDIPVIAEVTLRISHNQAEGHILPDEFAQRMHAAGASIIGVNCSSPADVEAFSRQLRDQPAVQNGDLQLSAMPNIGGLQWRGNRVINLSNPEFMGRLGRSLCNIGVSLIGGCCEVHPDHIREICNYTRSRQTRHVIDMKQEQPGPNHPKPTGPEEKAANGPFSQKLFANEFAVSVELLPPRGTAPSVIEGKLDFVRALLASGEADAIDLTDGSRGIPLMPPGDFARVIREQADPEGKLEIIPHFTSRDLSTLGLQSRLIGYHWTGLRNVLFITGDPPKMAPGYPRATAVFDLDSTDLIHLTHHSLNAGQDFGGRPLSKRGSRCQFTIGTGFEPEAVEPENELQKLQRKLDAGADYVLTQPAFRFEPLDALAPYRDRTRILIGVMVLTSLGQAERVAQVPGVCIPDQVMQRLARYESTDDQAKAGRDLAIEQARWVRQNGWNGLYLMSPSGHSAILDILASSK